MVKRVPSGGAAPCRAQRGLNDQKEVSTTMAKITSRYETIFILNPTLTEEATAAAVEKFKSLIEQHGTLGEIDEWGKRRLAYPIDDFEEGHYTLINFECPPDFPTELDRVYRITDSVLRSLIICKDE
jgi:small subunit ribosomal protein S6